VGTVRIERETLMRALVVLMALSIAAAMVSGCDGDSDDGSGAGDGPDEPATADSAEIDRLTRGGLETDFSEHSVDLALLLGGGPSKDGIPALTDPKLESVEDADADQEDDTRGIFVEFEGERRFYPFSVLVWHEIVNDRIGDTHFAVTF
jgi:hypothetical protein